MKSAARAIGCFATRSMRSEEHTSELQSPCNLVCRLLLEKKNSAVEVRLAAPERVVGGRRAAAGFRGGRFRSRSRSPQDPRSPRRAERAFFFFFNDTATTEIYTLSLHDALPIYGRDDQGPAERTGPGASLRGRRSEEHTSELQSPCNLVCRLLLEKKKKKEQVIKLPHKKRITTTEKKISGIV